MRGDIDVTLIGERVKIELPQAQRRWRAALQIAPHEVGTRAHAVPGPVAGRATVLPGQREHAHNAADSHLGPTMVDSVPDAPMLMPALWARARS